MTTRRAASRIAITNFYPMTEARRLYAEGAYPSQNLWGGLELEREGHEVVYPEPREGGIRRALDALTRHSRSQFGDIAREAAALRVPDADLLYSAADHTLAGVALLRSFGVLSTPVVGVFHNPPRRSWLLRRAARGYDLAFALSQRARDGLLDVGRDPETTILLQWGPQLDHPSYRATGEEYVISSGKSGRDIATLAAAIEGTGIPAVVYAPPGWHAPQNTSIRVQPVTGVLPFPAVMADMARASVVAIPLSQTDRISGLSELIDALAFGKPVVVTRSSYFDIDVESLGCGFIIEPGDVAGWRTALTRLVGDPELRREMGRQGRAFAERGWNATLCCAEISDRLSQLMGGGIRADLSAPPSRTSTLRSWLSRSRGTGRARAPQATDAAGSAHSTASSRRER